ncbi:hypothetical protein N7474_004159 [Penicillium riverlandense]|uniref:uncharacterized protein n=1 Tax=Penicillium riverlandense TaxID=1903569 RepID=UPI002548DE43|nr:uncharacterized protein N7474_004159 [Penicillium riverlandense]KAJ5818568.1 hypothetical protein N7474_004159 [Penicillium riverlandense]
MANEFIHQIKNRRRSSQAMKEQNPVLTAEDEAFLQQVTTQPESPRSVADGENPQLAATEAPPQPLVVDEGAANIPLPASPSDEFGKQLGEEAREKSKDEGPTSEPASQSDVKAPEKKKKNRWSAIFSRKSSDSNKDKQASKSDKKQSSETKNDMSTNKGEGTQQDTEDITDILDRLNLAADNNRVFSISDETQELLRKFKLIFKDLVNGVPTAYNDLESLLTNGNRQLQDTYSKLPGFLQKLIEKLPERWTETLAPEMLAAASARASASGVNMENVGKAAAAAGKIGIDVPSLKELVGKPTAIVGMLRSIVAFLRARFPAVMGMNVMWSLALFILLFVLWYCHKRGREVRLENERLVTEEEINQLNLNASEGKIRPTETLTTTAPQGASPDEVRQGVKKVEEARASAATEPGASKPTQSASEGTNNGKQSSAPPPSRSKSRLSIFSRSKSQSTQEVAPYPGT